MKKVPLDDEVLAVLARQGTFGETYNDVLRRVLGLCPNPLTSALHPRDGALKPLLDAGLLRAGQTLHWTLRNKQITYQVTVAANGRLVTADGISWETPNTAAKACRGHPVKGWQSWTTSDGITLAVLAQRLHESTTIPDTTTSPQPQSA